MNTVLRFLIVLPLVLACGGECNMPGGTGSTLTINPRGGTVLTMGLAGSEPYDGTSPYIVPLQTLTLNEQERWRIVYEQAGTGGGEGGRVVSSYGDLVPLSFWVVIKANTRTGLIAAYNALQAALLNPLGGTIAYKPEDVPASALTTYYHYIQSGPPRVLDQAKNRWDAGVHADGYFRLIVEVAFQTQPIATSDPDSPVTLTALATTVQNWEDTGAGQANSVLVDEADLKGTMPALLRITARPDAGHDLGELIMFIRDEGVLANFISVYEAEDAATIAPSTAWSEIDDPDRGGEHYMRCRPAIGIANGTPQGRRFTIANPSDHEGRFAVFGVGHTDGGNWTHQVKVSVGSIVQEGEADYTNENILSWELIYAGEFELPPGPLSNVETAYDEGPYVDWYATRTIGTSDFRLDGIVLVYVADSKLQPTALDVPCEDKDGDGIDSNSKLLIENFPGAHGQIQELAHIVAQADENFQSIPSKAPRGDFLMLDPTKDNLIVAVQQRNRWTPILDDDFESYKGVYWMAIDTFDNKDSWMGETGAWPIFRVEGSNTLYLQVNTFGQAAMHKLVNLDLEHEGVFTSGDFSCFVVFPGSAGTETIASFHTVYGVDSWDGPAITPASVRTFAYQKKSAHVAAGAPDWSSIAEVEIQFTDLTGGLPTKTGFFDWWRLEKADPDDTDYPNATGTQWNFQPAGGKWTITEDIAGAGATLADLSCDGYGVEHMALIDETTSNDVRFRIRVRAGRDQGVDQYVGIVWRAGPHCLTAGTEDCYAALLDVTNQQVDIREYNNGAITALDSPAFSVAREAWYVMGVIANGSTLKVFVKRADSLTDDEHVFDDANLVSTVTDGTWTTGQCGVMTIDNLSRFDDAFLEVLSDRHVPADEITLTGQAIFRTIAPFNE